VSDVLDQLGLTLDIEDGEMISDAVLVMKVHRTNGEVYVATRCTEGTDWVTARGLVAVAEDIDSSGYHDAKDE
jgi:hypothetical protein